MLYMVVCKVEEHGYKTVKHVFDHTIEILHCNLQMTLGYFGDNAEKLF